MSKKTIIKSETNIEAIIKLTSYDSTNLIKMLMEKGINDIVLRDMFLTESSIHLSESPNCVTLIFRQNEGV